MGASIPLARPILDGNERKYLNECLDEGKVTHVGRFEGAFEEALSKRFGLPALATSSGTGALHLSLLSLNLLPGDEVLVPSFTFGATAAAVLAVGAKPVIVDVSRETWGLDPQLIASRLTRRTRAIIPVHIYGEDAGAFSQFGLPVIEDAAESFGIVPIRGDMACFSFYGNKVITTGEGGAILGKFGNAREWRDGGFDYDYRNTVPGLNYRMSNMQAAIGLAQIERLDSLLALRLRNAEAYSRSLPGRGKWLFVVETDDPRELAQHLKENGVETRPVFCPLHANPAFAGYAKGKFKRSEEIWQRGLVLPTGPHVTENDLDKIVELIKTRTKGSNATHNLRGAGQRSI